ncbi:hypothetical protein WJT86_10165 [Microvirga sp. W0021]|uniref:Uncharacterized protein n=1 Tax=Hohaiivirga grylli TaxID=3133970 RepID=A0ABV0BL36_9HYPH
MIDQEKLYKDLPPRTRDFFEQLREEDIELLQDGLQLVRSTQTISKFIKWFIITLVGIFIASVGIAENIMKVASWFKTGK